MLAAAAGVVACLSGCADRANDLDTYYGAAAQEADRASTAPSAAPPSPSAPRGDADPAGQVTAAQLTDADVAEEGVTPALPTPPASACIDAIPSGATPPGSMTWQYPSGSRLSQEVNAYTDRPASQVLTELGCPGEELTVDVPVGADSARGWCADTECTVVLARGPLLSALHVVASTPERAAEAAQRLAPVTAKALQRQQ
ncbi:hypothetical protein CFN78_12005 [Amycolatopsis antarctica]|uniref:DUF3558 domain-containing protein n=1 Tax=Amycolatopsis antarctica TaxID=1854586 RepID=A0A263D4H4_9PSEU|nr:hypothetical protein CFN78_12005 [Amycolatopsis antarctica]